MKVSELRLGDFRNISQAHIEPSDRFNVFEGHNGAGKTNILEAIYVLGSLKSFRASVSHEMVSFGSSQADIRGIIDHSGTDRVVRVTFTHRGRKVSIDGKSVRSLADSLGQLTVVLFAPEDLSITKGSPSGRRRFIDRAVFNRWPASLADTRRYDAVLKQRNALLKQDASRDMISVYDEQLANAAARVLEWRQRYLSMYVPLFVDSLQELSSGELVGTIDYQSNIEDLSYDGVLAALTEDYSRDRARGSTNRGPHVDDLFTTLNGTSTRSFASQGQHRSFVLAMKIAEIRLLQAELGQSPVLLLDDVSSELDQNRNAQLMQYLCSDKFGGQVFLTTTDRNYVRIDSDYACFRILAGEVCDDN